MSSKNLRQKIHGTATSFSILIIYMSVKITESGPPIVQPSTCLKNLLFNLKVHSIASFIDNLLKTSFEQIGLNFL